MNALTPSAVDSSTITPFVPITHAGITCGLELISTTTSGLPVSRATSAKRFEHGVLPAEQFQCGGGAGLADQLHHIAHDGDNKVGTASVVHRLIQQLLVELGGDGELRTRLAVRIELAFRIVHQVDDVRAARIHDLASFGRKLLEPVKHGGDHLTRLAIRHPIDLTGIAGPIAQLLLRVIGKRAHHAMRLPAAAENGNAPSFFSNATDSRAICRLSS